MFHIHCGPSGFLGRILVDLGTSRSFNNGKLSAEITNDNIIHGEMRGQVMPECTDCSGADAVSWLEPHASCSVAASG